MPRTRKSPSAALLGVLIVIGLPVYAIVRLIDSVGEITALVTFVVAVSLIVAFIYAKRKARLNYLSTKYGDPTIVDHIFRHRFWQGQTAEQLIDSLGNPHGVDKKLLKTMKREVWKYNPRGVNRYGLRITLDNDVVNSWDHKQ